MYHRGMHVYAYNKFLMIIKIFYTDVHLKEIRFSVTKKRKKRGGVEGKRDNSVYFLLISKIHLKL